MGMTSLIPGYKLVEAFGPDEQYETTADGDVEEVVSYVTVDVAGIDPALVASSSSFRLIGLDTPTPFLQLSGTILKGRHQQLLGTELLFLEGKDDADPTKKSLALVGTTEQRIKLTPVELVPKGESTAPPAESEAKERKAKKQERLIDRAMGKTSDPPRRRRSTKGKERAQEQASEDEQAMVVEEDLPRRSSRPRKAKETAPREPSPLEYADEPTAMDLEEG